MSTVTGLVLTYNGARLLDECLASLSFCDTILVVDSQSTDETRDIAARHGATVLVRAWEGPGPQFRFALEQIATDWVVSLDQDEYLTEELRENILRVVRPEPGRPTPGGADGLAGCWTPRRSFYYDRFLKHSGWYPDYLLRVFRTGRMEVRVSGAHYSFHPQGPTEKLAGDIVHHPYRNLREHLDKINAYAQAAADEMRAKGKKGGLTRAVAHGLVRFVKLYLLKLGVLDGRAGFINAVCGAFYAFQKYIRVSEKLT